MIAFYLIIGFVVCQRLIELWLSHRNTTRLIADGGKEVGQRHYPLFIALHTTWLLAMIVSIDQNSQVISGWVFIFFTLQAARIWVIRSLGQYWTTRIITVPNRPLIRIGPYRYCRHPNYMIVAGEIASLPLAFGAWELALIFSALNSVLTVYRIRLEDCTLNERRLLPT